MADSDVRRILSAEDQKRAEMVDGAAFLYSVDSSTFKAKNPEEMEALPYQLYGAGRPLTSVLYAHDHDVWFDGNLTRSVGIGGVATLPEGRVKGGMRSIFEACLPQWYQQGYVFSTLYPFSHHFYRKFGYELVQKSSYYTVPTASLAPYQNDEPAALVTDPAQLVSIADAFGKRNNLTIRRKPSQWGFVSKDPYKDVRYTYKIGEEAYLTFKVKKKPQGGDYTLNVVDLAFVSPQAFRHLLGFIYTLRAQFDQVEMQLPDSLPMHEMIDECYDVSQKVTQHGMARVINLQKALQLMAYPAGSSGSFTMKVSDPQISQNDGCFKVSFADGKAVSVEKQSDANASADLAVDIQTATRLTIGSLSISEALYLPGGFDCPHPEKISSVFTRRDIYFNDGF